jgi:hypothetical protein
MRELSLLFQSLTKTSLVTTQTQVKQLGAAFSGTQTRPLVNFAYFYEMVFQSKDYSFGPSQHYGSLSFHVHKCFSKNNPAYRATIIFYDVYRIINDILFVVLQDTSKEIKRYK